MRNFPDATTFSATALHLPTQLSLIFHYSSICICKNNILRFTKI